MHSRWLEVRRLAAASFGDRVQPETVCLILAMRTSLSGLSFVNATSELRLNRRISVSQLVKVKCRFSTSESAMPPRLPRVRRGGSANSRFAVVKMVRRERGPLNALRPKKADDRSERYKASKPTLRKGGEQLLFRYCSTCCAFSPIVICFRSALATIPTQGKPLDADWITHFESSSNS